MADRDIAKIPLSIKITGVIILLIIIGALLTYFIHFDGGLGDNNAFGTFGDYIGGILNPILGFFTIVLLIWSLRIQTNELNLTREELSKSSGALDSAQQAHHENIALQKREHIRREIQDDFEFHWTTCQTLFKRKVLTIGREPGVFSFHQVFMEGQHLQHPLMVEYLSSIPARIEGSGVQDMSTVTLLEINNELHDMSDSVVELFKFLDTKVVALSIHSRLAYLANIYHNMKLLDEEAYSKYLEKIAVPERFNNQPNA